MGLPIPIVNPFSNTLGVFSVADQLKERKILESLQVQTYKTFIDDIPIDVLEEDVMNYGFEITDRPLEDGSLVTDARRKLPDRLSWTCIQTDDQEPPRSASGTSLLDGALSFKDKYDEFMELKDRQDIITATTSLDSWDNMLIENLSVMRNVEKTGAMYFTIELKESNFVSTDIADIDPRLIPRKKKARIKPKNEGGNDQGAKLADQGSKTAPTVGPSIAKNLATGLADLIAGSPAQ